MVVHSVRQGQLWYHGLKRAARESKHKVSPTVNRYVSCFINEHFVSFLVWSFLRNELAFPFQRWLSFRVCSLCPRWEWQTFWADYNF